MNVLHFFSRLYSPDTLDTRFSPAPWNSSRQSSPQTASGSIESKEDTTQQLKARGTHPQKWTSSEFMVYGLIFLVAVPWMFKTAYDVSQPSDPQYPKFEHLLSPGWIPGRKVDNSDQQYASFRDNVPYLFIVLLLHPLLRRAYNAVYRVSGEASSSRSNRDTSPSHSPKGVADQRLEQRISFDLAFGLIFLVALHGFSAPKVLIILYINYSLATRLQRRYVPIATWIFNIGILFANEFGQGYHYETIANTFLSVPAGQDAKTVAHTWATYFDSVGGLIPRWEVLFNITVLRLISFNFDYYWGLDHSASSPLEKKQLNPAELSERDRVSISARPEDYSFRNYLSYAIYSPLYLAGPILTFNDYIAQARHRPQSITVSRNLLYGLRFSLALLSMEITIHYIYVVAISKSSPLWSLYTPFQLSMLGYLHLQHIWLKLLLPWRFFRLWSLIDGIDPPENVVRCMSDNVSTLAFWRGWHRSFNRWIVRYIYIPMGGSGTPGESHKGDFSSTLKSIMNVFTVFSFVAIWHDIQLRLLIWGWLITLFVLPELIARWVFPAKKWKDRPEEYRILCGVGAVGNILMMMIANLVGFAVGLEGLKGLLSGILGTWAGGAFMLAAFGAIFAAGQVIMEWKARERRLGFKMKC